MATRVKLVSIFALHCSTFYLRCFTLFYSVLGEIIVVISDVSEGIHHNNGDEFVFILMPIASRLVLIGV